jgi:hypothetical protein
MAKFINLTRYGGTELQLVMNTSEIKTFRQYINGNVRYTQIITHTCTYEGVNQTPEEILELMKNAEEV